MRGAERLLGSTFPFGEGIAGTVAQTGEAMVVDDLSNDPRFARSVAEGSGYVPNAIMVAPLLGEESEWVAAHHPGAAELSMGMSLDYPVAVEEGATMVRIGTALFGARRPEDAGRT